MDITVICCSCMRAFPQQLMQHTLQQARDDGRNGAGRVQWATDAQIGGWRAPPNRIKQSTFKTLFPYS